MQILEQEGKLRDVDQPMKKRSADVLSGRHFVRTALDVLWIFDFFTGPPQK